MLPEIKIRKGRPLDDVLTEAEKKRLVSLLQDQRGLYDAVEKRIAEQRQVEEQKNKEEKEFLMHQGNHLEAFLQSALQTA